MKIKLAWLVAALAFICLGHPAAAVTVTGTYTNDGDAGNQATGTGPFVLTSTASTYSYIHFIPDQTFNFNQIQLIGATFTDTSGGAGGGSPRLQTVLSSGDFFSTYLGPPPSFNDPNPVTFTAAYSGTNLNNGTNNTGFQNSGSYQPFDSFFSTYGGITVTDFYFIVDSGWFTNGTQSLILDSINVEIAASEVPIPAALPLFVSGIGVLGFVARRRKRKVTN
jgi:hypothetical protein